jgi:membrane associated rhomboid family serine protease
VGYVCPECAGADRKANRQIRVAKVSASTPVVTYSIMAICAAVWLLQVFVPSLYLQFRFAYTPQSTLVEPWRMLTSGFLHDSTSILHLGFNMWSLFVLGRIIEPMLGRWRFAALYLLSMLGGSVLVLWLVPSGTWVVGASGAIFGLMGALFVLSKTLGVNVNSLFGVIAINLFLGFVISGIAWQAHIGGLLTGCLVAWIYARNRSTLQVKRTGLLLLAVTAGLVVFAILGGFFRITAGF